MTEADLDSLRRDLATAQFKEQEARARWVAANTRLDTLNTWAWAEYQQARETDPSRAAALLDVIEQIERLED